MDQQRIIYLHQRYLDRTATDAEIEEFRNALQLPATEEFLKSLSDESWELLPAEQVKDISLERREEIFAELIAQPREKTPIRKLWTRIAVAASIILVTGTGLYLVRNLISPVEELAQVAGDVAPGKQGATLTLADGRKIRLSDAANGELAKQAGVSVSKTADGQLIYEIKASGSGASETGLNTMNTLSTARGETYQVRLPDGSLVVLNSASSLTYSANLLRMDTRSVQLEGEAYFEVTKDKAHPFLVQTALQKVEVLGTHFNINSYRDEASVKTTLLEGSVKVSHLAGNAADKESVLRPGEQSTLTGSKLSVAEANIQEAIAWKEGYFRFYDEKIESIMRKLSRWYNIEVQYNGEMPNDEFNGRISRYKNISQVLKQLEKTEGVHFKIEGRRILVMK